MIDALCKAQLFAQIERMVLLIQQHTVNIQAMLRALWFVSLREGTIELTSLFMRSFVAKIQDLDIPLMRNQNIIIKLLMAHRQHIISIAHITENVNPQVAARRLQLLESKDVCPVHS